MRRKHNEINNFEKAESNDNYSGIINNKEEIQLRV